MNIYTTLIVNRWLGTILQWDRLTYPDDLLVLTGL